MTALGWIIWATFITYLFAQGVYFPLILIAAYLVLKFLAGFFSAMMQGETVVDEPVAEATPLGEPRVIDVEVVEMRDRK